MVRETKVTVEEMCQTLISIEGGSDSVNIPQLSMRVHRILREFHAFVLTFDRCEPTRASWHREGPRGDISEALHLEDSVDATR